MPTVDSTITVSAPIARVYDLCRDIEAFPEFMDDVREVKILEQTEGRQVSRWVGEVKEFKRTIQWTEEDFWNREQRRCDFKLIEGDLSAYEGYWTFTETPDGGTTVLLSITYEYDVPLIGALIQGLLKKKMQGNSDSMLAAIKQKAEG